MEKNTLVLVESWPKPLQFRDKKGRLSLHLAYCYSLSSIICYVLGSYLEAVHIQDEDRQIPLHYACDDNSAVIEDLVKAWTDSVHLPDNNGNLPLHVALLHWQATETNILVSLESWPESSQVRDYIGSLPLHLACCYSSASMILIAIHRLYMSR